jgi:predicted  nucleic acid-binding Zn ribbon protein
LMKWKLMGAYGDEDNICLDLNGIKLVQHELLQEISDTEFYKSTKHLSGKIHMSNRIQIHYYSIERYSIIPRSKLIIKKSV